MIDPVLLFMKRLVPGGAVSDLFATTVQVRGHVTEDGTFVAPHQAIRHKKLLQGTTAMPAAAPLQPDPVSSAPRPPVALILAKPKAPPQSAPDLFSVLAPQPARVETAADTPAPASAQNVTFFDAPAGPQSDRNALAGALAASGAPVRFTRAKDGRTAIAGPDMAKPGMFRLTLMDQGKPVGHVEFPTLAEATLDALRNGYASAEPPEAAPPVSAPPPPAAAPPVAAAPGPAPSPGSFGVPAGIGKAQRRKLNAAARKLLASKTDAAMTDADKAVLRQYSGTGQIGDSINEFYTPPAVASAVWTLMERAGFTGGAVLEPSAGTGVFLHTAPSNVTMTSVEMDPISSRICGILHPAAVNHTGTLEKFAIMDGGQFDAVVGNPPFGLRGASVGDDKRDISKAELYFVDTALDKLKDGGLCAMVLPSGVMDAVTNRAFRESVLCKAEFLGASRMPNTAFEAAHTAVTTDVVLLRKRPQEVANALGALTQGQMKAQGVWDDEFIGGTYFSERGAANVNGVVEAGWRAKAQMGNDTTVAGSMVGVPEAVAAMPLETPKPGPDLPAILKVFDGDKVAQARILGAALRPPYQVAKIGDVKTLDGVRYILQGDPPRWHRAELELDESVADILRMGESLSDLGNPVVQENAGVLRAGLIEDLDAHIAKYGLPDKNRALRAFLAAPSMPNTDGAEPYTHGRRVEDAARRAARLLGAVSEDGTYSDLVTGQGRRTDVLNVDTAALKLALEDGKFTPEQLAERTGRPVAEVVDHLFASPGYALATDGQTWSTMDTYTSGDLWPKYDAAIRAADEATDPALKDRYTSQAAALEATIQPQSLEDVEITLASGFVEPGDITAFFRAEYKEWQADNPDQQHGGPSVAKFAYDKEDAVWSAPGAADDAKLALAFLNRAGVQKKDKAQLDRLNERFAVWLRGSDKRDAAEERYNRTYRGFRAPIYSDAPIEIPGINPEPSINNFHFAGLRWALEAGSGIVAADVGLGKTPRGLMLNKLLKATGSAKKPVIVVPKSVLANWVQSTEFWFPGARTLVIGETYSRDKDGNLKSTADSAATKRAKYHQLQQNDYDFVLISQPAWNALDVSPERKQGIQDRDFWSRRSIGQDKATMNDENSSAKARANATARVKADAKAKIAYDQNMAVRDFKDREATVFFDELGVDAVIMDEGHAYKNLYSARARFGESPKFLGGSGESARAQDTYIKSKVVRDASGGKGIFMLTATPTKNSPLEVYSMLSHIAPEAFERMGILNSEAFLDRFCEFSKETILTPTGEIEEALITSGFKNLDELREVMRRYIDRKTAADVGLKIPMGEPIDHYVDMTDEQESRYQTLRSEFENVGKDATGEAHVFSIMSRMGKASIDLALLDGDESVGNAPKVDECVRVAIEGAKEGGQVIFCDHVDMHERIAAKLVASGVPSSQIGILNAQAAVSGADRQRICDKFNAGTIRYVIGNTPTMGEGVNLQIGTTDIHHLDLPWEPASMQQRNGRGVRQGNTRESVRLHTYLAKRSFDGYRLQTIRAKKDWQDLLWNGGDRIENLAREGAFSRTEQMILMAADPDAARIKFDADRVGAEARKNAAERGTAIVAFNRYNKMQASLAKLTKGYEGPQTAAMARLDTKQAQARQALLDMPGFAHADLLASGTPALVQPTTGMAFPIGGGVTLLGGDNGPAGVTGAATNWRVMSIDADASTVTVRPYGVYATTPITMHLDAMREGVTTFDASDADEAKRLKKATTVKEHDQHTMSLHELKTLPEAVLRQFGKPITERMLASVASYEDMPRRAGQRRSYYPGLGYDGEATLATRYTVGKPGARLMLPLPEHRQKAIDAYVNAGMRRQTSASYDSRRASLIANYRDDHNSGVGEQNPWTGPLRDLYDEKAVNEGDAGIHRASLAAIREATTLPDAIDAAHRAMDIRPTHGDARVKNSPWPREHVMHLAAKAAELGKLDTPLEDALVEPARGSYSTSRFPSVLFHHKGTNYAYTRPEDPRPKVRNFLAAIAHPDDAAAIHGLGK